MSSAIDHSHSKAVLEETSGVSPPSCSADVVPYILQSPYVYINCILFMRTRGALALHANIELAHLFKELDLLSHNAEHSPGMTRGNRNSAVVCTWFGIHSSN